MLPAPFYAELPTDLGDDTLWWHHAGNRPCDDKPLRPESPASRVVRPYAITSTAAWFCTRLRGAVRVLVARSVRTRGGLLRATTRVSS
jgi:hypothetical protein